MNEINIEDIEDLSEITRLVVLIELEPLSDRYMQVVLPHDAYKKMSDAVWETQPISVGRDEVFKTILVRPMKPVIIPDLHNFYAPEYIAKLLKEHRI